MGKLQHVCALAQFVEIVRPSLHYFSAVSQVLGPVVSAPVGILHSVGKLRLNHQRFASSKRLEHMFMTLFDRLRAMP